MVRVCTMVDIKQEIHGTNINHAAALNRFNPKPLWKKNKSILAIFANRKYLSCSIRTLIAKKKDYYKNLRKYRSTYSGNHTKIDSFPKLQQPSPHPFKKKNTTPKPKPHLEQAKRGGRNISRERSHSARARGGPHDKRGNPGEVLKKRVAGD